MNKTIIITDNAACLSDEECQRLDIEVFSLPFVLGETTYYEKELGDLKSVMQIMEQQDNSIFEAQVSLQQIDEVIQKFKQPGVKDIIWIHLAHSISGIGSNLMAYAKNCDLGGINLHIFDAYTFGPAQGKLACLAATLANDGVDSATILHMLEKYRAKLKTLLILGNLKGLKKTGSISNGVNFVSNALLKPKTLLRFSDTGELEVLDTHLRMKKFGEKIEDYLLTHPEILPVTLLTADEERLADWQEFLTKRCPQIQLTSGLMPAFLTIYSGTKSTLITWE